MQRVRRSHVGISKLQSIYIPEVCLYLNKKCRPWRNEALNCILSGSSLFAKIHLKEARYIQRV